MINFLCLLLSIKLFLGDSMKRESLSSGNFAHYFHKKSYSPAGGFLYSSKSCKMSLKTSNNFSVETKFKNNFEVNYLSLCKNEDT